MSEAIDREAAASLSAARITLKTVFGIDAEDGDAVWFAREQKRTSLIVPRALANQASLFDVRMSDFDALLHSPEGRDDQPARS